MNVMTYIIVLEVIRLNNTLIKINSKDLYLGKNFLNIKNTIRKRNCNFIDMGSFIEIKYENYNFVLNDILNLNIYLKNKDVFLNERIKQIEKSIGEEVKGFSFEI